MMRQWSGEPFGPRTEVFSDVSCRHGAIGYCCAVLYGHSGAKYYTGDATDWSDVTSAEIAALAIGLRQCPDDALYVTAYTDLDWLPKFLDGMKVSYATKIAAAIDQLRYEAQRFRSVKVKEVRRGDGVYQKCHRQSRLAAIAAAQSRGTFGKFTDAPVRT